MPEPPAAIELREQLLLSFEGRSLDHHAAERIAGRAAGVTMTVIPILIFFMAVQRYFVRGLAGAVKG